MVMNQDTFNMELRKFLKKVGINSQREIENAVRSALERGNLSGAEKLDACVHLQVDGIGLSCEIRGTIALE